MKTLNITKELDLMEYFQASIDFLRQHGKDTEDTDFLEIFESDLTRICAEFIHIDTNCGLFQELKEINDRIMQVNWGYDIMQEGSIFKMIEILESRLRWVEVV